MTEDQSTWGQTAQLRVEVLAWQILLRHSCVQLADLAAHPHDCLSSDALDAAAEHVEAAGQLLGALDDVRSRPGARPATTWRCCTRSSVVVGLGAGYAFTRRALSGLRRDQETSQVAPAVGGLAGAVGAAVALHATERAGSWWLPGLLVWSVALATAAVCDAWTERVPTTTLRTVAVAVVPLMLAAAAASSD
jgi:hypothetical protein